MDTGIIFIHYIYLVSRYYYVNLIRVKSAFAETLRNAWNLRAINLISIKINVSYHIILKLIMFSNESKTFFIQSLSLYDFSNLLKWTVSRKKYHKKLDFYVHLNWIDDHSALSINLKTLYVILKECGQLLIIVWDLKL